MHVRHLLWPALILFAALFAQRAVASDGCAPAGTDTAARIAQVACAEHALWYSPFIDENGRLAHLRVSEAEALRLRDGTTPAWRRVAAYWQGSGLSWPPDGLPAQADCYGNAADRTALCRAFLIDTPWSAVFVSYVMTRAGVPGFARSARHVDYVRQAWRAGGPYRLADPDTEAPAVGDMLCFARTPGQVFGVAGFRRWLETSGGALAMHCDIVVSTANARARLVGGNVLQGVTMRVFPLNSAGRFWGLPRRTGSDPECSPAAPSVCNLHRQDWVALLKLDPSANLPAPALPGLAPPPATPCCKVCQLPMPAGMQRCSTPSASGAPPAG